MTAAAPEVQLWLTDSELAGIDEAAGGVDATADAAAAGVIVLRLAAARVDRPDPGGRASVEGHALGVTLRLSGARRLVQDRPLFGRIRSATLQAADGRRHAGALPLPGRLDGPWRLELELGLGGRLLVTCDAVTTAYLGPPNFRESLAC